MKKFLFLLSVVLMASQLTAGNVDRVTAQHKAEAFLKAHTASTGKLYASGPIEFVSERVVTNSNNVNLPVYYTFNTKDRFVIVSGEDRGEEILGVGDGAIDFNNIPCNMQAWLDLYKKQIEYLQDRPGMVVEVQTRLAANRASNVSPMLTAKWNQQSPYYNECVINGVQCVTGCPATSLAQVFYYWKYPTAPTGVVPAYRFRANSWSSWTNVAALPSITFDWANMKNSYTFSSTSAQKTAVAKLMRYIGQAEHMEYGSNGSGISSDSTVLIANACKFYGYDNNVRAIKKTSYYGSTYYSDSQWANLIQGELEAGHPIVYCAISDEGSGGGHAFNVDGYTVSSNKYHINWGWGGYGDGDFALNAFTDADGWTFDIYQQMVIGIQPPGGQVTFPVLNVEPESLDFGTIKTGQTVTRTFHVTGTNLLGDITFTRNGNGFYSVTPETLTAAQVQAGADITVTYAPLTAGTHTCNIDVAGGAAETMHVACTGTAEAVPTLVATPSELSFTGNVGESVTATYTVTGYNMTGTTYLSVLNSGGVFSINKSNITKANIANGVEVTVTYKPKAPGVKTARVMMRSAGADTIYVELTGTATLQKYNPVMLEPDANYITPSSFRADWTDETADAGVSSYTLECYRTGQTHSVFTDITDKFYTVKSLTPGATYYYKVKALYTDNTESAWSNIMTVTLPAGHAFEPGDLDHDGSIGIADVGLLIDMLLGNETGACIICADVDGDGEVAVGDVSSLIDILLNQ